MADVNFYFKPKDSKENPRERGLIIADFMYNDNKARLRFSTQQWVSRKDWDFKKQRAKSETKTIIQHGIKRIYDPSTGLNVFLVFVESEIKRINAEYTAKGKPLDVATFKRELNASVFPDPPEKLRAFTVPEMFDAYIKDKPDLSEGYVRSVRAVKNLLTEFAKEHYPEGLFAQDISIAPLDFYNKLKAYKPVPKKKQGDKKGKPTGAEPRPMSPGYFGKNIKSLKIVLNHCWDNKKNVDENAHKETAWTKAFEGIVNKFWEMDDFAITTGKLGHVSLRGDELERLYHTDLSKIPWHERVRDMFVFMCFTGLRYSDWDKVDVNSLEEHNGNGNGKKGKSRKLINVITEKTGEPVSIPLWPVAEAILMKYGGKLPKPISNQKTNEALKEIGKIAGLTRIIKTQAKKGSLSYNTGAPLYEKLTSHSARKTFATLMIEAGHDKKAVMAITGHKTEAEFNKYVGYDKKKIALDMFDKGAPWGFNTAVK